MAGTQQIASLVAPKIPRQIGEAIFLSSGTGDRRGFRFAAPTEIVRADRLQEVVPALERVEKLVANGQWAAGFLAYEAGAAFDNAMPSRALDGTPYLWFGIYASRGELELNATADDCGVSRHPFDPGLTAPDYTSHVAKLHEWIAAGDTYQANFTFPFHGRIEGRPREFFLRWADTQPQADYRCYLDLGPQQVLSLSPELFFRLEGNRIVTRPMKGTARRGLDVEDDILRAEALAASSKERAENVMIVDLLRNDLGRIAEYGSVSVDALFEVERYATVWQMTSTVSAQTHASVPEIFAALFPSGSVTGAPKLRTMEILHALEPSPRGVYCGAIGWWGPDRSAEFSVGIRTMTVDTESRDAVYPVGSGITWDADAESEYAECLLKADVLTRPVQTFDLLESLLLQDGEYFLLDRHLARITRSASYFGYRFEESIARAELARISAGRPNDSFKVRFTSSAEGELVATAEPIQPVDRVTATLAPRPVDTTTPFVYHKTTHRAPYLAAAEGAQPAEDILFYNTHGELTETTRANIVLELDGRLLTPPIRSGLLAGTFREHLLESGEIEEQVLHRSDLARATRVCLINSVRGWMEAEILGG